MNNSTAFKVLQTAAEFVGGEQERSRKAGVVPSGCSLRAFLQIVTPQRLDDRHGSRPWRLDIDPVTMVWWTRRRGRVESERDERLQPCAEDIAEVSLQCRDRLWNARHSPIVTTSPATTRPSR